MEIKELLATYSGYALKHRLVPVKHRTSLAYIMSSLSDLFSWVSPSGDPATDKFTNILQDLSHFYRTLESNASGYGDTSEPFLIKDKIPHLFVDKLADFVIQIMIYVSTSGIGEEFMAKLEKKMLEDSKSNSTQKSRFNNKRMDW